MNDKSLCELMNEAFGLSLDCAYGELSPDGHYLTVRELPISAEKTDLIFAWADGLMHKYYQNVSTGHCSLNQMVNFDIEKFENKVIETIQLFKDLLDTYGKPITLTFEEMQKRGYRGAWAGYTKEQDKAFYFQDAKDNLAKAEKELKEYQLLPKKEQNEDKFYYLNQKIAGWKDEIKKYSWLWCGIFSKKTARIA